MLMGTRFKWLLVAAFFGLLWAIVLWPWVAGTRRSSGEYLPKFVGVPQLVSAIDIVVREEPV